MDIRDFSNMSRREALLTLVSILNDDNAVIRTVNQNAVLDCAIAYVAQQVGADTMKLRRCLDIAQLNEDISHAHKSNLIRELRSTLV